MSLTAKSPTAFEFPTEIDLPEFHFPADHTTVEVSGGKWEITTHEIHSVKLQRLRWWHAEGDQEIKIEGVKRKPGEVANPAGEEATYMEQCQRGDCTIM